MLSKNTIQFIRSLNAKKYRQMYQKYLAEGEKIILELIEFNASLIDHLYGLPDFIEQNRGKLEVANIQFDVINADALSRISNLKTPQNVLGVIHSPGANTTFDPATLKKVLYLDKVRDPGNLGTIIRSAEWFGWDLLVLSQECVDPYNPKVVQSAMGSLFRLRILEQNLMDFLNETSLSFRIFSAEMDGGSVYDVDVENPVLLIMGNESHGVQLNMPDLDVYKISIPRYTERTESLNVAVASSILMAEFNRRGI